MSGRTLLQALVLQRTWTFAMFRRVYEQAARDVAAATGDRSIASATVEEQTFRRWTSGRVKTVPNYPAPQILEHIFGHPANVLLREPLGHVAPQANFDANTLDESELSMTARDAAAHANDAASQTLPDMSLDQLDDDVSALARAYSHTSPVEVYRRSNELLHLAQAMLERTQIPRQRTRVYLAAGQSAALLSAICFDLGSIPSAIQLSRTAALYGQVIEHGPLQAYAHGALALLAYWDGRPSEAVRLVHTAQQFGGLGDTAKTRLAVIEARAFGHLRNKLEAGRAIRMALEQDAGLRDDLHDDIGGEFAFPRSRVAMSNATTYLLLREAAGAETSAGDALRQLAALPAEERSFLVSSQASIDLARARLLRRELEGAQEALASVFLVPSEWRGAGILERLAAVRVELSHPDFHRAAEADALGERIEDFSRVSVSHQLSTGGRLALGD